MTNFLSYIVTIFYWNYIHLFDFYFLLYRLLDLAFFSIVLLVSCPIRRLKLQFAKRCAPPIFRTLIFWNHQVIITVKRGVILIWPFLFLLRRRYLSRLSFIMLDNLLLLFDVHVRLSWCRLSRAHCSKLLISNLAGFFKQILRLLVFL